MIDKIINSSSKLDISLTFMTLATLITLVLFGFTQFYMLKKKVITKKNY